MKIIYKDKLKRRISVILLAASVFCLASCNNDKNKADTTDSMTKSPDTTTASDTKNAPETKNTDGDLSGSDMPTMPDSGMFGDGSGIIDDIIGGNSTKANDTSLNTHAPTGGDGQ